MDREAKTTLAFSIAFALLWSWAGGTLSLNVRWLDWASAFILAVTFVWGSTYNCWVIFWQPPVSPLQLETADVRREDDRPLGARTSTLLLIGFAAVWLYLLSHADVVSGPGDLPNQASDHAGPPAGKRGR